MLVLLVLLVLMVLLLLLLLLLLVHELDAGHGCRARSACAGERVRADTLRACMRVRG